MDPDAAVLADLARARRRHRLEHVDLWEKLYQAYLSVIAMGVVVAVGASLIGDERVDPGTLDRISTDGPALVGLLATLVLVVGARSGLRGGPLTLEPAFVAHVLLSPVGRDLALRAPALRQLSQSAMTGAVSAASIGLVASHRLPVATVPLLLWATVAGAAVGAAASGLAMVVAGLPVPKLLGHAIAVALVAGGLADVAADSMWSPGSIAGRLALAGVDVDLVGLAVLPCTAALAAAGVALVGGTSIEAARRRAGLVSQLRFAVTRQDLRTVVLLQRRLAQDAARRRPWVRVPAGRRLPVARRGFQGLARLPLVRVLRVVALSSVAVAAAVGVWRGTTPLVLAVGIALWAAALDVVEPLAQELDHPGRWAGHPVGPGDLLLRHVTAPTVALVLATCIPVAVVAVAGDTGAVLQTAAGVLVPACLAAVLGAGASVAAEPFDLAQAKTPAPEAIGTQMIFRAAWPPAVAVLASLPLLSARDAAANDLAELPASTQFLVPVAMLLGLVAWWLSRRKPAIL